MPATVMIHALDDKDPIAGWRKGSLIIPKGEPTGWPVEKTIWGDMETLPRHIRITVSDRDKTQIDQLIDNWRQDLDITVTGVNEALDRVDVRISAAKVRQSDGLGGVTREQVETYVVDYNATVRSAGVNDVSVRFTIFDAAISEGYIRGIPPGTVFAEQSHDRDTATHVIRATVDNQRAYDFLLERLPQRGTIIAQDPGALTIDYQVTRNGVLARMNEDVQNDLNAFVAKGLWFVDPAHVDSVVAAMDGVTDDLRGGMEVLTGSEFDALLMSQLDV